MYPTDLATRAQDYLAALAATLPHLRFEAFTPHSPMVLHPPLYVLGFLTDDLLIGGYTLESPAEDTLFPERVLSMAQFFQKAWTGEYPRFFPPGLQTRYEVHRESQLLWQRVA
jgi:hypothetical protein